jgi:hypothetical protein
MVDDESVVRPSGTAHWMRVSLTVLPGTFPVWEFSELEGREVVAVEQSARNCERAAAARGPASASRKTVISTIGRRSTRRSLHPA